LPSKSIIQHLGIRIKKALAHESGAEGVFFDEKTEGQKSCDNVSVMYLPNIRPTINDLTKTFLAYEIV
jgi:hypothetical protein